LVKRQDQRANQTAPLFEEEVGFEPTAFGFRM